jgi:hypothetical protein
MGASNNPPKDANAEREAKLAQALRANLRRRKAVENEPRPRTNKPDERS